MSKFKIGDKVRCIYSDEEKGCGWFLGKEFIVDSLNSTSSDICYFPKNENGVYENGLELVEDTLLGVGDVIEMIGSTLKGEKAKVLRIDKQKEEVVVSLFGAVVPLPVTVKIDDVKVIRREEGETENAD